MSVAKTKYICVCTCLHVCLGMCVCVCVCVCTCVVISYPLCVRYIMSIAHLGIIKDIIKSLFTYRDGKSWADYYHPSFSPVFEPTFSDPDLEEDAREICDGDTFCLFDIAATKRVDIGMSTMQGNQELERIIELSLPGEWYILYMRVGWKYRTIQCNINHAFMS